MASETARLTQANLKAEKSSLTFLHGIGLKIEGVQLDHPQARIQARHINVNVRLLPLLLGKIEVSTLDVHDAHVSMGSGLLNQASLSGLAALPVKRIRLVRASLDDPDGNRLLEDVRLDLRNIGVESEALWELQAEQGGRPLNGHGSLDFRHGEIRGGFGKLKFDAIPLAWLAPLAPGSMRQWFTDPAGGLSGALTLDIKENNAWSIFGEVAARASAEGPPVSFRGKLHHPSEDQYFWDDSFIRLSDKAVITTKGQCFRRECQSSLAANGIPLAEWGVLLPEGIGFLRTLTGSTDVKANLQWKDEQWQATGDLLLKSGRYHLPTQAIELPELYFDQASITGDQEQWQAMATLSVAQMYGKIAIESGSRASGSLALSLKSDGIDRFPQALLDMLLASLDMAPGLLAEGKLAGNLQFQRRQGEENMLQFSIAADQTRITLPAGFEKPAGVAAQCQGAIRWPTTPFSLSSVQLERCQLGSSGIAQLAWDGEQRSVAASGLELDLTTLRQQAVGLPASFQGIEGRLAGELTASWPDSDWPVWLAGARGALTLHEFGTADWRASGELHLDGDTLTSPRLGLRGAYGHADLQGSYNLNSRHGSINILSGELNWSALPPLPEKWAEVELSGDIQQGRLRMLDNELSDISGHYKVRQGSLQLGELKAEMANGLVYSPSLSLTPNSASLSVQGHVRGEEIQLSALGGIGAWLQAELDGKLHLNLDLHGQLPATALTDWHYSNGDILIYNGSWRPEISKTPPERQGIEAAAKPARFSMFSFRFRVQEELVDISRLELRQGERRFTGVASISGGGKIHGATKQGSGELFALEGAWPLPHWQAAE